MTTWIQVVLALLAIVAIVISQTVLAGSAGEETLLVFGSVVLAGFGVKYTGRAVKALGKKTPPTLVLMAVLTATAPNTGCDTFKDIDWPDVANCGVPIASDLIATVSRIYLNGNSTWRQEIIDLGRIHGTETVACLTDVFIQRHSAPGAAKTPETLAAVDRARSFLDERGIQIQH